MVSADDMFQKIDELFNGIPDVFDIAYDILITGFDEWSKNHDATSDKVLRDCRQVNFKLNRQLSSDAPVFPLVK